MSNRFVVYSFVFVGIIFSFLISYKLNEVKTISIQKNFEQEVDGQIALLDKSILLNIEVLKSLKVLFDNSEYVSHEEFSRATSQILLSHKSIKALEWIPKVLKKDREAFEQQRRKYFPNYEIVKESSQRIMERVEEKDIYFPVSYLEPYKGNESVLGFDLSSNKTRYETLKNSMYSDKPLASSSIKLVQDGTSAFLIFMPLYTQTSITIEQRKKNLEGFILGVFKIDDIFVNALKNLYTQNIILELMYSDRKKYFYKVDNTLTDNYTYYKHFSTIPGQNLIIKAKPKKGYIESRKDSAPIFVFVIGVVFSITAGMYTMSIITYSQKMEKEVALRTKDLHNLNKKLEELSKVDGLTQLYNRRYFDEMYEKEFKIASRNAQPLALLMIDIDYFKNYNDTYGHMEGDKCLKEVATCLRNAFHRPADIISRYGGEEFSVILPNTSDVDYVCKNLLRAVRNLNISHSGSKINSIVTISIGANVVNEVKTYMKKEEFLEEADKALYEAKEEGRDRFKIYTKRNFKE